MPELWWIHLGFGPFLLVVALLFWKFPPGEINAIYGYRTRRSMASQEAWDFANGLCTRWMLMVSGLTILCQLVTIFTVSSTTSIVISAAVFFVLVMSMIPVIEGKLKRRFGSSKVG